MTLPDAAPAHRSWDWLIAVLIAYGLFLFFAPYLRKLVDKIKNPSPPPAIEGVRRTKVQATVGVTEDEPNEPAEVGWWGRIVEVGGLRFRQAKQIMATGSHELPDDDGEDIDVPLDDPAPEADDTAEMMGYIRDARRMQVPYKYIVDVVMKTYGVSESTAKRRIREVDEARRPKAA